MLRRLSVVAALAGASVLALWLAGTRPPDVPYVSPLSPRLGASAPGATASPVVVVAEDASAVSLGKLLIGHADVAADVVFLVVASVRTRCDPPHRHDLVTMASQARLPVLAAATQASASQHERARLMAVVRQLSQAAPCGESLELRVGPYEQIVDPQLYATAFPDSYFDPGLRAAPTEYAGMTLQDRAADECTGVAYAVLPLDAPRAWHCTALRSQGRARIRALCREHNDTETAARAVRTLIDHLPSTCR